MRIVLGGCTVVLVVLVGTLAHAVEPLVLYDNFNAEQVDVGKWVKGEEGAGTEPTVQIQDNRLRLFNRSYGKTDSNQGRDEGSLFLTFSNSAAVTAIQATVQVNDVGATGCPHNSQETLAFTLLGGSFFNTATPMPGSELHDLWAIIGIYRNSDMRDPANVLYADLCCWSLHERRLQGEHMAPLQRPGACQARGEGDAPGPVGPRQPAVYLPARR